MCGIAGFVGSIEGSGSGKGVRTMVSALARRGPDSEGIESWPDAVLGHRRLAIFDLSDAGRQPMLSADGRVGIVFNGSIYNYRELREDLKNRGCRFRSDTDTEVLVYGYIEWGLDALLKRSKGMFAFALWDSTRRKLFLVRDRLGVKPLCYAVHGRALAFASTPRALRSAGLVDDLDPQALLAFLSLGYVPDQLSVYRGAKKVPAATVIEWEAGELTERKYWQLPEPRSEPQFSFDEAVEETERLFLKAVESRLYAHVPVGSLLSGGIDSALVCWAIAKLGGDITAFTVGVPGDPWDETKAASETAKRLGVSHKVLQMSEQEEVSAEQLTWAYAEPFAAASGLGMLRIAEAVSGDVTVLLTGDGGDDVFLGYPRHRHLWAADKVPRWARPVLSAGWGQMRRGFPRKGALRRFAAFLDYASGDLSAFFDHALWLRNPDFKLLLGERLIPQSGVVEKDHSGRGPDALASLLSHEYRSRFVGEYMTKVDGATMYHALEARSPFLDQDLWEFAAALPYNTRLHSGKLKAVLRRIATTRLGPEVAKRRKIGFGIPVQRWLSGRWRKRVEDAFQDSLLAREGWVNASQVLHLLRTPPGEHLDYLWHLYVLELWMQKETAGTSVIREDETAGLRKS